MSTRHPSARSTVEPIFRPPIEPALEPIAPPAIGVSVPPAADPAAGRLRARAGSLRTFAARIERSAAMRLDEHAGRETWHSPRADLCRWVLGINLSQLQRSVDELLGHAHQLERQAAEIEAALATAPVAPVAATMSALAAGTLAAGAG